VFALDELELPIVGAPLAGGPATVALAAAVSEAGGQGSQAAGYRSADDLRGQIAQLRAATPRPFAVNLFARGGGRRADASVVEAYRGSLAGEQRPLGDARHDDDDLEAKLAVIVDERPAVVSFTFGCPDPALVARLQEAGVAVWVTVTTPAEARAAADAGADALVAQGVEAGGHRGTFDDAEPGDYGLLALLQLIDTGRPVVAAGGIMTGAGIAAVLAAGAAAAQLGSALLRTPEAGTSDPHRRVLAETDRPTGLTRAFTGRTARGILNRFQRSHPDAPSAYPEIHHVTAPLRAAARADGDAEAINLWAGQAYPLAQERPAGELVRDLAADARARLRALGSELPN
jgi:nitronate monooxygenase